MTDRPLAEIFLSASQTHSSHSVTGLRFVGDLALFLVGFYADALRHAIAGTSCYVRLGRSAYGVLGTSRGAAGAAVLFNELLLFCLCLSFLPGLKLSTQLFFESCQLFAQASQLLLEF